MVQVRWRVGQILEIQKKIGKPNICGYFSFLLVIYGINLHKQPMKILILFNVL